MQKYRTNDYELNAEQRQFILVSSINQKQNFEFIKKIFKTVGLPNIEKDRIIFGKTIISIKKAINWRL